MSTSTAVEPRQTAVSTNRSSRIMTILPLALLAGTFLVVAKKVSGPVTNSDTYFHLRLGEEFLSGWSPSSPGSVSRFASADWAPTQLLGQLVLAQAERWGGLSGVATATAVSVVFLTAVLFLTTRSLGSLVVAAALTPLAVLACAPALSGRPQVMSYAFAALVTWGWLRRARGHGIPWWVVPLVWFWSMVHGMWSVGVLISIAAIVGLALDRQITMPNAWRHLAVPVLSLAAVVATPMGTHVYASSARVGAITAYFAEWAPPDFTKVTNIVAAALAGILVLTLARRGRQTWTVLCLSALAGLWLIYSARTVPVAVAMLLPLLGLVLASAVPARPRSRWELPTVLVGAALACMVGTANAQTADVDLRAGSESHASVDELPPGTALLNEWAEGGYDMWRHPTLDIVSHGYGDMFTDEELKRNVTVPDLDPGWYEELTALGATEALLYTDSRLTHALVEDKGWQVVARDSGEEATGSARVEDKLLVHLRAPAAG